MRGEEEKNIFLRSVDGAHGYRKTLLQHKCSNKCGQRRRNHQINSSDREYKSKRIGITIGTGHFNEQE